MNDQWTVKGSPIYPSLSSTVGTLRRTTVMDTMKWSVFLLCIAATAYQAAAADTYTIETEYVLEEDTTGAEVVISRLDSTNAVNFKYTILDSTANVAEGDFPPTSMVPASFGAGTATVTVTLTMSNTDGFDPGEQFSLKLEDFDDGTGAFSDQIQIVDSFDIDLNCRNFFAKENREEMEIVLRRVFSQRVRPLTITVAGYDLESFGSKGLPKGFSDYTSPAENVNDFAEFSQTITMDSGVLKETIIVDLVDDVFNEGNEPFIITITGDHIQDCTVMGVITNDDAPKPYHCRRDGQGCQNGGVCNTTTGACDCPDDFIGNDCAIAGGGLPAGCDSRCGAGGFCQSTGGAAPIITCHCKPGFAGEFCNNTAYNTMCNQNTFGLCVTPYGDFGGKIYIDGQMDVPECNFAKVEMGDVAGAQSWCEGYYLEVDYTGMADGVSCGTFTPETDGSNTTHIALTKVQYSPTMSNDIDEGFTSYCRIDADGVVMSSDVVTVNADPKYLKKQVSVGVSEIIDFSINVRGDGPLTDTIYIDDQIEICANVDTADAWNCVRLKQVILDNNRAGGDYKEGIVYEEGCVPDAFASSVMSPAAWKSGNMKDSCMIITPFRFDQDFELEVFEMRITVIADLPTDACTQFACDKRRKRQVAGEENVAYILEINTHKRNEQTSELAGGEASDTQTEVQQAEQNSMLPLIIGATIGGTLLVASIIAIAFIALRRRRKDPFDM